MRAGRHAAPVAEPPMARIDRLPIETPKLPAGRPRCATLARIGRFLRPYRRQVVVAAIALVVAAAAVLAIGQGLKVVIDRGFGAGDAGELDRALALMLRRGRRDGGRDLRALLLRVVAGRARDRRPAARGVRPPADAAAGLLRGDAHRRGDLAAHQRHDDAGDGDRLERVDGDAQPAAAGRRPRDAGAHQRQAHAARAGRACRWWWCRSSCSAAACAGSRARARTASATSAPTSTRRCTRSAPCRRTATRRRTAGASATRVEAAFGTGAARIRQRALLVAAVILLVFGAVGVILWIGGHDVVAGRHQRRAAVGVRVLRGDRRERGRHDQRGDRRPAARGRRHRAAVRAARRSSRRSARPRIRSRCRRRRAARSRFDDVTFRYPSRPDAPALDGLLARRSRPGEKRGAGRPVGRGQDDGVPAAAALLRSAGGRGAHRRRRPARRRPARTCARRLALVPQDPVIFAASVLENVRYGRPDATDAEVRAACEAAYATEFIERLPERLRELLGERGVRLSGGQRQRLAIARAILADRPILLLDEATSALDAESERMVQLALERLMAGRTVLIIAHRLATVRHADRIAVMERGRIVAAGTHDELVARQPALRAAGGAAVRRRRCQAGRRRGAGWRRTIVRRTMIGSPCPPDRPLPCSSPIPNSPYELHQPFEPAGDQPEAIAKLVEGLADGLAFQTLLGVTGSGKTFTMANVIARTGRPGAGARAEQDARGAALLGVPRVLPEQRGRVLRLVLRLLPARGLRPVARPLHREGQLDQRAHRADAAVGDQGDPRAAATA